MNDGNKNLTVPRGDRSVWDKPRLSTTLSTYDRERWAGAAIGTALAIAGTRRGGMTGWLLGALGATLAVRAASGRHDVGVARDWLERAARRRGYGKDIVADASEDSFPASDSPAWTASAGARSNP